MTDDQDTERTTGRDEVATDEKYDPIHLLYLEERGHRPSRCEDVGCPGWYFDPEDLVVVRCAECARYKDDLSARGHVRRALGQAREDAHPPGSVAEPVSWQGKETP